MSCRTQGLSNQSTRREDPNPAGCLRYLASGLARPNCTIPLKASKKFPGEPGISSIAGIMGLINPFTCAHLPFLFCSSAFCAHGLGLPISFIPYMLQGLQARDCIHRHCRQLWPAVPILHTFVSDNPLVWFKSLGSLCTSPAFILSNSF